jgi:3'-phosphoadenosine 5'-phosphosulfate sulfotransferase (PAPS reductase)/FAD synthetase
MHKQVLKSKRSFTDKQCREVFNNIPEYVSKDHIQKITEKASQDIQETIQKYPHYSIAFSGGKDSLPLLDICNKLGYYDSFIILTQIEFPDFETWIQNNIQKYPGQMDIHRTHHDIEWIKKHPQHLFTNHTNYLLAQQGGKYFKQKNLDIVIAGARKIDGNVSNPDGHITNKKGYHRYFPLYNWTHEEVLAYIYYYNLELPPIYQHEDGFTRGTGNWTKRPPKGLIHGWKMTEKADPNLIKLGLKHNLPGIHEYIQLKQGKGE